MLKLHRIAPELIWAKDPIEKFCCWGKIVYHWVATSICSDEEDDDDDDDDEDEEIRGGGGGGGGGLSSDKSSVEIPYTALHAS